MIIKSTRNTVFVAVVFSVLSGVSTLGTAKHQDVQLPSVHASYADFNFAREEGQQAQHTRQKSC
jgi:hypothetical protein